MFSLTTHIHRCVSYMLRAEGFECVVGYVHLKVEGNDQDIEETSMGFIYINVTSKKKIQK